jgi:hypothetical protein
MFLKIEEEQNVPSSCIHDHTGFEQASMQERNPVTLSEKNVIA